MKPDVVIKELTPQSDPQLFTAVANMHKEIISEGFLASFGVGFLAKLYYAVAKSSESFVYTAELDGKMVGFICGSLDTGRFYKDFIRHHAFETFPYILKKTFNFKTVYRILETLLYPSKQKHLELPDAEILNFCVDTTVQRGGVGKGLFKVLIDHFDSINIDKIKIVTGSSQTKAQQFYSKNNAQLACEIEVHKGVKSLVFTYDIKNVH